MPADVEQLGQLEIWEAAKVSRCPAFGSCQPRALRRGERRVGTGPPVAEVSRGPAGRARIAHSATGEIRRLALQLGKLVGADSAADISARPLPGIAIFERSGSLHGRPPRRCPVERPRHAKGLIVLGVLLPADLCIPHNMFLPNLVDGYWE